MQTTDTLLRQALQAREGGTFPYSHTTAGTCLRALTMSSRLVMLPDHTRGEAVATLCKVDDQMNLPRCSLRFQLPTAQEFQQIRSRLNRSIGNGAGCN